MSGLLVVANSEVGRKYRARLNNRDLANPTASFSEYIMDAYDKNGLFLGGLQLSGPKSTTDLASAYALKLVCKHPTKDKWAGVQVGFVAGNDVVFCNVGGGHLDGVQRIQFTNNSSLWIA